MGVFLYGIDILYYSNDYTGWRQPMEEKSKTESDIALPNREMAVDRITKDFTKPEV